MSQASQIDFQARTILAEAPRIIANAISRGLIRIARDQNAVPVGTWETAAAGSAAAVARKKPTREQTRRWSENYRRHKGARPIHQQRPIADKKEYQRLCWARLRAERAGRDTSQFPPRIRQLKDARWAEDSRHFSRGTKTNGAAVTFPAAPTFTPPRQGTRAAQLNEL